jgi:hypothetical protein
LTGKCQYVIFDNVVEIVNEVLVALHHHIAHVTIGASLMMSRLSRSTQASTFYPATFL